MKGLSILLTLAVLVLAHELSICLKRSDAQHTISDPVIGPLKQQPDIQLQARTNSRGLVPKHLPASRAEGNSAVIVESPIPNQLAPVLKSSSSETT